MTSTSAHRRRALGARLLVPLMLAAGALPLMAPSCGASGEGVKVFSRRSLIIPMDVCYQYMTDGVRSSYAPAGGTTACPAVDQGDVIRAYGLVYQLIRNGIAVYWVIDNAKTAVDAVDLTIQYQGGFPVFLFDWATGLEGAAPTASLPGDKHTINYRGGPFVVDGSDFARASAVLQSFRSTFGSVNVHVSNVAFRGYSKRTMAGGWSAGGAVPPKLALLDIGSSGAGAKNSEVVIQGYLTRAGLDTPGAMGTATGTHGEIFDRLFMPDFIPATPGDWRTTTLAQNGYQILWVPHWAAPSSCSDCPPSTSCTCQVKYDSATIASSLQTIGSFVSQVGPVSGARGDVFAECAGLGSFEGVFSSTDPSNTSYSSTYVLASQVATGGEPTTHFETEAGTAGQKTGVWINKSVGSALYRGSFSSPLMQIGDYPFLPRTGAIQNFKPNKYKAEVVSLVSEASNPAYDIFTLVPGTTSHGTVVYLGGHSYSGTDGVFEVAGSRLVLNTLFNLGSACTATGVPCQTGLPGVCAAGEFACQGGPDPVCVPKIQPGQVAEICNGLDDDCDGQVDEDLQSNCYEAPAGYVDPLGRTGAAFQATSAVGVCRSGISVCQRGVDGSYAMSACSGQVLPAAESCNGLDDDCNGAVDDGIAPIACYDGPGATLNVGICHGGSQLCQGGQFGAFDPNQATSVFVPGLCGGEQLPKAENCSDAGGAGGAKDDDCDGVINNGCTCNPAIPETTTCFSGPGTAGVGICTAGQQTCQAGGVWGACVGQVVATTETCVSDADWTASDCANYPSSSVCQPFDKNCDGAVTKCPDCSLGQTRPCPDAALPPLPPGSSWSLGQCARGTQHCTASGTWGGCTGTILPSTDAEGAFEYCDGKDNTCDGVTDESARCPAGDACIRGVCVQAFCGTEMAPPEGYACSAGVDPSGNHTTVSGACGALPSPGCGVGQVCQYGNCVDPCPVSGTQVDPDTLQSVSLVCGKGTVCGGGACIAGSCYETGCADTASGQKQVCLKGTCQPDPCDGKFCPSGTFCRQGDCVQACTFVSCLVGERCGQDGFCEPDLCAGKLCGPGQRCTGGVCAADPCLGKSCATGQVCVPTGGSPLCVDDPCTGVTCPAGACAGGQCFRSGNMTGAGTVSRATTASDSGGGCGCGAGSPSGLALPALLGLLALPLARRRRRAPSPAPLRGAVEVRGRAAPGGRGALLLVLVAVSLLAAACKEKKTESQFDPSTCAATCEGEQRCVDLSSDPAHCGACGHACAAGEQCVDGLTSANPCGPSSLVAPYLRSLTPTSGVKDTPSVTVSLAGDRLQQNAQVRLSIGSSARTLACPATPGGACQWLSASALSVKLDLSGALPAVPWLVRVVNPDGVISNSRSFTVTVPTPALAGVVPASVPAGSPSTLVVSGTGFTSGSRCQVSGIPGVGDLALVTTLSGGGAQLDCVLDATSIPPGVYTLKVVSEPDASGQSHASNTLSLTVTPSDPVIYAVDPTSASAVASFRITGTRFDAATAAVVFSSSSPAYREVLPAANVTRVDAGTLLVHDLAVGSGTPRVDALYTVAVRNGTAATCPTPPAGCVPYRTSNGVTFVVGSQGAPALTSFSPSTLYQGESALLGFGGTNIPASPAPQIELQPPGSTTYAPVPGTTLSGCPSCVVSATRSFVGAPEGLWSARVRFGPAATDPTSAPWPLRVLSNQAILRDYQASPDPAQAGAVGGTKDSLVFTVSNVRSPGVKIFLVDPAGLTTVAVLDPTIAPTVGTSTLVVDPATPGVPALSLAGYQTGTYTFRIANPNASPSNALPFAVNPGRPTLASPVCVAGTSCTRAAMQADAPVTLRLTGTNFASPDVNGNGSVVMAAADFMPNWFAPDLCDTTATTGTQFQKVPGTVTVVSPTQIDVQVDSRSAFVDPSYGTTYYLGVWNPGGVSGLQKSSCGVDPRTLPWFRLCATAACLQ